MLQLYKNHLTPPHMQQYVVERIRVDQKTVVIHTSLEPWGHYHVYNYAQIFGEDGQLELRVTVESDDADQAFFASQHPKEAAAGLRSYSLDGYQDAGMNKQQQRTEKHFTFKFFVGQPSYDVVRNALHQHRQRSVAATQQPRQHPRPIVTPNLAKISTRGVPSLQKLPTINTPQPATKTPCNIYEDYKEAVRGV